MLLRNAFLLLITVITTTAAAAGTGKSYTAWDCFKPACAQSSNLKSVSGVPHVCDTDSRPLST
ncbi:hypothetical protein OQA88_5216 [Cercophora sp. LCS_1]